jgi:hypothetical protein
MVHLLNGALIGHSIFQPLDISKEVHIYSELLEDNNFYALHTLGVHPIRNQFREYPLCYIYQLWPPGELHLMLLGFVKYLLSWQLKDLKVRQLKDRCNNQFTSVP